MRIQLRYMRRGPLNHVAAAITMAAFFLSATNCVAHRWRAVPMAKMTLDEEGIAKRRVRFWTGKQDVTLLVTTVDLPYVTGQVISGTGIVQVDLRTVVRGQSVDFIEGGRVRAEPLDLAAVRQNPDVLMGRSVTFVSASGSVTLRGISRVVGPWVEGQLLTVEGGSKGLARIDLEPVTAIDVHEVDGVQTAVRSIGVAGGIVAGLYLIVLLTKESCPFVYIDRGDGWEFVGEAYAGAAFRAVQREDLLPLPAVASADRVQIRLRNEAHETQYTDRAELVLVDHRSTQRALSTFDGKPVLVAEPHPALSARDGHGRNAAGLIATRDERMWVTNPDETARITGDALADELTAEFALPKTGTPLLELVAGNTPWLDLVFGRFFAAMGDHLPEYLFQGNLPFAKPGIQSWREREGVDLAVDVRQGRTWRRVAVVPTVGPAALREIAVPLPAAYLAIDSGRVMVRLRGGLGFWRIDRLAMSTVVDAEPPWRRVAARTARGTADRDERDAITSTDGRYNSLSDLNEFLDLEYPLPPAQPGQTRTVFLSTTGYYNVHPPVQGSWQPDLLAMIRDEPGGLSRFGQDLAREYMTIVAAARASTAAGRDRR